MTTVVCDANIVVKWVHPQGEPGSDEAFELVLAASRREIRLRVLDLTYYEVGNALIKKKALPGDRVATILRRIPSITGPPLCPVPEEMDLASELADRFGLTLYDAAYWATARSHGAELATVDRELLAADAGSTPAQLCERLGIEPPTRP